MQILDILGYAGSLLLFISAMMQTMIPLRIVGILANIFLFYYGLEKGFGVVIGLQAALFILNFYRLFQQVRLVKIAKQSHTLEECILSLLPFMDEITIKPGQALFSKGDRSDAMYIIKEGSLVLPEYDAELKTGEVVGEIGILSPNLVRMASAEAGNRGACVYKISDTKLLEMYFQNPRFGLNLTKIAVSRLSGNLEWAQANTLPQADRKNLGGLPKAG